MLSQTCIPEIKPHMVWMYLTFYVLICLIAKYFFRISYVYAHKEYWSVIFLRVMSSSTFDLGTILSSKNELENIPSSSVFWNSLGRTDIIFSLSV